MKRMVTAILTSLLSAVVIFAADNSTKNKAMNSNPGNIVGKYHVVDQDGETFVKIYRMPDGTYRCQNCDGKPAYDKNGKMILDQYNQDESLRSLGVHEAVLIFGLKYDAANAIWTGGKIHHPYKKMMKANCDAYFVGDGKTLCIFGNVAGMGAKRFWTKIE